MTTVENHLLSSWQLGNPVYYAVDSSKQVSWKIGGNPQVGKTFSWNIKTITLELQCSWQLLPTSPDTGNPKAVFWAKHSGESNSGQIIRLRNAKNPNQIVWQSAAEENTSGSIWINVGWNDPVKQDLISINQMLYSDMDLQHNKYNIIRPSETLSPLNFPVYVTQEYASTTNTAYVIRYLGFISDNPARYYNGMADPISMDDQAREHGISLTYPNNSGIPLNVNIKLTDGRVISGILPEGACVALLKADETTRIVGYIPKESVPYFPGPGVAVSPIGLSKYFKTF
jgi:hypothetical protein